MKVLVVGSGGREHAIVDTLARSPGMRKLFVAPGNGGMREVAELVPIRADNVPSLIEFATGEGVDLTFVGPEVPLSKGIVDAFRLAGMSIVGPTAEQARLESSKSFAKRFLRANRIPTAEFSECSTPGDAYALLEKIQYPAVIKADGLAAGKGVIIAGDIKEGRTAIAQMMELGTLGEAGRKVVIEEFLTGDEMTFLVFADGTDFQPMVETQDHKRRFDGDVGPNTGGMGAYSVDTILTPEMRQTVLDTVIRPTLDGAETYSGILYAGLMLTPNGPKVIEYNSRFGDPEAQVVLPRLKTDLLDVCVDITEHRLAKRKLEWRSEAAATVVLVAKDYPGKVESGKRIYGLDEVRRVEGVTVYHAATGFEDGRYYTAGGRVLNVTALGGTLAEALDRAYGAAEMIEFEGKDYRKDIGKKGLAKENETGSRHYHG